MLNTSRIEAERLLGIAEKLLQHRDLTGSRDFAILAQETEPLLEGSDQILAIVEVFLAAEKPVNNQHLDWYGILQVDRRSQDHDFIKKQYRRLALLLHPDKNRFSLADHAFKLVADAWAVLSDPVLKTLYDKDLTFFSRVDLTVPGWVQQDKLPVRPAPTFRNQQGFDLRNTSSSSATADVAADDGSRRRSSNFWTACPYCYLLYEYPRVYEGCCLRCQNCERSFHGVAIPSLPPLVPGQEAYYCSWGFFPMGFVLGNLGSEGKEAAPPPTELPPPSATGGNNGEPVAVATRVIRKDTVNGVASGLGSSTQRKRGRPRKVV